MPLTLDTARTLWLAEHVLPLEPGLRSWLRRRMPHLQDVDDVIQETYAILAGLADVSHVRQPRAYVFQVAQSVVLQQLRRAQVVPIEAMAEIDQLGLSDAEDCPERRASSHQELARVQALIESLPDICRQAFVLRRVEGCTQRVIARRMQISENTVEKHIGKALRLLMEALGRESVAGTAGDRPLPQGGGHARHGWRA